MSCPKVGGCPLFNGRMAGLPGLIELYKQQYCTNRDYARCARYIVATGADQEPVPADLYPPQRERAARIVAEAAAPQRP